MWKTTHTKWQHSCFVYFIQSIFSYSRWGGRFRTEWYVFSKFTPLLISLWMLFWCITVVPNTWTLPDFRTIYYLPLYYDLCAVFWWWVMISSFSTDSNYVKSATHACNPKILYHHYVCNFNISFRWRSYNFVYVFTSELQTVFQVNSVNGSFVTIIN
jgi:hypothetical protein